MARLGGRATRSGAAPIAPGLAIPPRAREKPWQRAEALPCRPPFTPPPETLTSATASYPPASLRRQLATSHAALALVGTALLTGLALRVFASASLGAERPRALRAAAGVAPAFAASVAEERDPSAAARQLGLAAGGRVVRLGPEGTVWVDGFGNPQRVGTRLSLPPGWNPAGGPQAGVYATGAGWAACALTPLEVNAQPETARSSWCATSRPCSARSPPCGRACGCSTRSWEPSGSPAAPAWPDPGPDRWKG